MQYIIMWLKKYIHVHINRYTARTLFLGCSGPNAKWAKLGNGSWEQWRLSQTWEMPGLTSIDLNSYMEARWIGMQNDVSRFFAKENTQSFQVYVWCIAEFMYESCHIVKACTLLVFELAWWGNLIYSTSSAAALFESVHIRVLTLLSLCNLVWCFVFQEQQDDVEKHCVNSEPHHGELWCSVSKSIKNWRLKPGDILPLASAEVQIPT